MYTIGIVEDEIIEQAALRLIIEKHHPEIEISFVAGNSEIALEYMHQYSPDILLLDISLPGENGLQLGVQLRNNGYTGQIIINTAYALFHYAQRAVQINTFDYLLKPCDPEQISKTIDRCIAKLNDLRKNRETQSTIYHLSDSYVFEHLLSGDKKLLTKLYSLGWPENGSLQSVVMDFSVPENETRHEDLLFNSILQEQILIYRYAIPGHHIILMQPRTPVSEEEFRLILITYALGYLSLHNHSGQCSISALCRSFDSLVAVLNSIKNNSSDISKKHIAFFGPTLAHAAYRQLSYATSRFSWMLRDKKISRLHSLFESAMKEYPGDKADACTFLLGSLLQALYSCGFKTPVTSLEKLMNSIFNSTVIQETQLFFGFLKQNISEHSVQSSMNLAVSIIANEYMTQLSQGSIADRLGMNQAHFSQQFKKHTGMNFTDYLTEIRMEYAKECILSTPSISLTALSEKCGYTSKQYFCNVFRKYTGMTVSQFREIDIEGKEKN